MNDRRRFSASVRAALYLAADGRCQRCGVHLEPGWHADHMEKVGRGAYGKGRPKDDVDSTSSLGAEDSSLTAQRLAEQHPDEYAAVERGEKTLNQAARDAGIRRPRILVRLDDADSAARTLRSHMSPDVLADLARLLAGDG